MRELLEESVRWRVYSTFTPPNPPSDDDHIKVTIKLVSVALLKSRMYVKFPGRGGEPATLNFYKWISAQFSAYASVGHYN